MQQRLTEAIGRIAEFRDVTPGEIAWEPLSGMTNVNCLVRFRGVELVVRFPGEGTERFIDRGAEVTNSRSAYLAGLTNEITLFDPADSVLISAMAPNARPHTAASRHDPSILLAVTGLLKRTHQELAFANDFNPFGLLATFNSMAHEAGHRCSADLAKAAAAIAKLRPVLESPAVARVACHNDPVPENFLETEGGLLLIDWEYSGRNDPAWDLASLCLEWDLTAGQELEVLAAYASDDESFRWRVTTYRPVADLVWSVWAIVQTTRGRSEFAEYGEARLNRCLQAISSPEFNLSVRELRTWYGA